MNLIEKVDHGIYIQLDVCYNWLKLKMVLKMAFKHTVQIVIHWWKWGGEFVVNVGRVGERVAVCHNTLHSVFDRLYNVHYAYISDLI